jgi:hypothetical protein
MPDPALRSGMRAIRRKALVDRLSPVVFFQLVSLARSPSCCLRLSF